MDLVIKEFAEKAKKKIEDQKKLLAQELEAKHQIEVDEGNEQIELKSKTIDLLTSKVNDWEEWCNELTNRLKQENDLECGEVAEGQNAEEDEPNDDEDGELFSEEEEDIGPKKSKDKESDGAMQYVDKIVDSKMNHHGKFCIFQWFSSK